MVRDAARVRNLLVEASLRDQMQHLRLAAGKLLDFGRRAGRRWNDWTTLRATLLVMGEPPSTTSRHDLINSSGAARFSI